MTIAFTLKSVFFLIGVTQGVFLSFVLFSVKRGKTYANIFLALFILSFSLITFNDFLTESRLITEIPDLLMVFEPLLFVLGPLCYFYILSLTDIRWRFKAKDLIHFVPLLIALATLSFVYLLESREKLTLIMESYEETDISIDIFSLIVAIQMIFYFYVVLKILKNHTEMAKAFYSDQKYVNLNWMRNFIAINSVLWIIFAVTAIFGIKILADINDILFPFAVYLIGYFGIKQPEILFADRTGNEKTSRQIITSWKDSDVLLSEAQANELASVLLQLMEKEKLFLINDLRLTDVAKKAGIPLYQISWVINNIFKKNFNDFVNEYRVEEFKKKLSNPDNNHLTILAIGMDSGFNSKATMNSVFKTHAKLSPSQYRKTNTLKNPK